MRTRALAWAGGVLEAALVLAVLSVPLFVDYYSHSVFVQDKAALAIATGALAMLAAIVVVGESGVRRFFAALRRPLPAAAALMLLAWIVATAMSVVRRVSILGSYDRGEGLLLLVAYVTFFGAAAWLGRLPGTRLRLAAAVVAGSVPVALMGYAQALGFEAVAGRVEAAGRVFGTLSNPIFLGAYLMMAGLLALGVAGEAVGRRQMLAAVGAGVVALMDAGALLLTDSRGPIVGAALGVLVFVAAVATARRRRGIALGITLVALVGIGFLALFNMEGSPLAGLRTVPVIGRFGRVTQTASGSERTRLLIWQGVHDLLGTEGARVVIGYGPESLKYMLLKHVPPNVAGGAGDQLADRAHNILLDALTMTGVLGALALVLFFLAWVKTAGDGLGLRGTGLAAAAAIGGLVGLVGWFVWPVYGAALLLLGMALGVLIGLGVLAAWPVQEAPAASYSWLNAALLAVVVAAMAEGAFGIVTVATGLVLWVLAGLAVSANGAAPVSAPESQQAGAVRRGAPGEVTLQWNGRAAALGLLVGLAAGLVFYSLLAVPAAQRPDAALPMALALALAAIAAGLLPASFGGTRGGGFAYAISAFSSVVVYLLIRAVIQASAADAAVLFGATVWWLCLGALVAGLGMARGHDGGIWGWPAGLAYPVAAILVVAGIQFLAVRPVQADIYFESAVANFATALQNDDPQSFQAAQTLFDRAKEKNADEPLYYMDWAELFTKVGEASADTTAAAGAFQQAQSLLTEAENLDPRLPYYAYNRGHLQLVFAQTLPPEQGQPVAASAAEALQAAFNGAPSDLQVALELGQARLAAGDAKASRDMAEYVLNLDPANSDALVLRGRAFAAEGNFAAAQDAFQEAIKAGADSPEVYVAMGEVSRQQGDLPAARNWYGQAAQEAPNNWMVIYNLGLLYKDTGDLQEAVQYLSQAMGLAPASERARVQAALDNAATDAAGATP